MKDKLLFSSEVKFLNLPKSCLDKTFIMFIMFIRPTKITIIIFSEANVGYKTVKCWSVIVVLPCHFLHVDHPKTSEYNPEIHQSKITADIHVGITRKRIYKTITLEDHRYKYYAIPMGTSCDGLELFFTKQRFSFISLFAFSNHMLPNVI